MAGEIQTQTETPPDTQTSATTEASAPAAEATGTEPSPSDAPPVAAGDEPEKTALGVDPEAKEPEAPQGAPEKYELALEGVDLDTQTVADAEPVLRELNLSNDQANKLLPLANTLVERTSERLVQELANQGAAVRKGWLDEAKGAEDIGGPKWDETLHVAAKGLDAMGYTKDHPFRVTLLETGFGNHPDMIRMAKFVGERVGEDGSFVRSNSTTPDKRDVSDRWYSTPEAKGS